MAFNRKNFALLAFAGIGPKLFCYTTADAAAVVDTAGYFNGVSDVVSVGDFVLANVATGGTLLGGLFLVTANSGGVVDVNDMTQIGTADTD